MKTYWNGEPTLCEQVKIIVGGAYKPTYWYASLEGTKRKAIKVSYRDKAPFYLDDEDGSGWLKVTEGRGMMTYPHASISVRREVK